MTSSNCDIGSTVVTLVSWFWKVCLLFDEKQKVKDCESGVCHNKLRILPVFMAHINLMLEMKQMNKWLLMTLASVLGQP